MPKRFTTIGAIVFGVIAAGQSARIYFGADIAVNGYHVPMLASWGAAIVAALLCVMLFREANA
jgi:lipopolysaccharide export LptBFGC system permease protein LptF